MSIPSRILPRMRQICRAQQQPARSFTTSLRLREQEWPQRTALGPFYKAIMEDPLPHANGVKPEDPPLSAAPEVLPEEKKPVPNEGAKPVEAKKEEQQQQQQQPKKVEEEKPAKRKPGRPRKNGDDPDTATTSSSSSPPTASQILADPPTIKAPKVTSETPPVPSPPPTSAQEKARAIFGEYKKGSPEARDARLNLRKDQSTLIAGVLVPPKPEEPENCCMSGCVNCVWDLFREEMEEFTARRKEAEGRLEAKQKEKAGDDLQKVEETKLAEKDGGSGEEGKMAKDMWDEEVFQGLPVGIREFMKQEKRLKEQHEREGTSGG